MDSEDVQQMATLAVTFLFVLVCYERFNAWYWTLEPLHQWAILIGLGVAAAILWREKVWEWVT